MAKSGGSRGGKVGGGSGGKGARASDAKGGVGGRGKGYGPPGGWPSTTGEPSGKGRGNALGREAKSQPQ